MDERTLRQHSSAVVETWTVRRGANGAPSRGRHREGGSRTDASKGYGGQCQTPGAAHCRSGSHSSGDAQKGTGRNVKPADEQRSPPRLATGRAARGVPGQARRHRHQRSAAPTSGRTRTTGKVLTRNDTLLGEATVKRANDVSCIAQYEGTEPPKIRDVVKSIPRQP